MMLLKKPTSVSLGTVLASLCGLMVSAWVVGRTMAATEARLENAAVPHQKVREGPEDEKDAGKKGMAADLQRLEGMWRLVGLEIGGRAVAPETWGRNVRREFSGSAVHFHSGTRVGKSEIRIEPSKTPKRMEETWVTGVRTHGIYELKGNTLRLFLVPAEDPRPTEFKTRAGTKEAIATYERVLPEVEGALPQPLPDEVVRTWKEAGARVGLMWVDRSGGIHFNTAKEEPGGLIPGFQLDGWRDGVPSNLPDPGRPFGLDLLRNEATDAGLKELAVLKSLRMLHLGVNPVTDAGLKELAGLKSLEVLDLGSTPVTDAGLKELTGLKNLESLKLFKTRVTDAGLKDLAKVRSLRTLNLVDTSVTDAGLKELAGMMNLQSLDLGSTRVTDAGLKEIGALKNLRSLFLRSTLVTDAGLKELAGLKNLQTLDLFKTEVTDVGLKDLAGLQDLQELYLGVTLKVTDAGLQVLAGVKNLQKLSLFSTNVTGTGLKELAGLQRLQWLSLWNSPVTDAGLKEVAGLKHLQSLALQSTRMTDAGLKELAGLKNLRTLHLGGPVTDAWLKELAGLKSLRTLVLVQTPVTDAGIAELRRALPDCRVRR